MPAEIEILSPLPAPEALRRLREAVGRDVPLLMMPASHPERPRGGLVRDRAFALRLRTPYGNSFGAVCRGVIDPTTTGSVLRATMGMPRATMVFLAAWFAGVMLIGGRAAIAEKHSTVAMMGGFPQVNVGVSWTTSSFIT